MQAKDRRGAGAVRAWFDLARAGNFPSVLSNVLAATWLSWTAAAGERVDWLALSLAVLGGILIYAGGATLNDVFDAAFDAARRPERAIPSGRVGRFEALVVAVVEMGLGVGALLAAGAKGLILAGLVSVVVAYDWLHKRWLGSVVLMAGCRVMLALAVASLPGHVRTPALHAWLALLFAYIVVVSLLARWEYRPGAPAARLGRAVGRLLAFIPLLDALVLALAGAWPVAMACAAAIPLGRWTQRLAAST
jgi:4-hydroxybenzoate polyprenyltransferase